jgi:predicted RNA binding protein YcfA (HicA-like mRNA interferase family)
MPRLGAIKRRDLIRHFRQLGFAGPFSGGRHQFMLRGDITVRIPNPHRGDIRPALLARILRQAGVTPEEWEGL